MSQSVREPQIDLPYSDETEARGPHIAGGLSLAIRHTLKIIDPELKHRATEQWEQAFQIFNQLLPGGETACESLSPLGGPVPEAAAAAVVAMAETAGATATTDVFALASNPLSRRFSNLAAAYRGHLSITSRFAKLCLSRKA